MSEETKRCTKCRKKKIKHLDFYMEKGAYRAMCKACVIKRNAAYQKENETWKTREPSPNKKTYMLKYYQENKEKYKAYMQKYRALDPDYFKKHQRKSRDKKRAIKNK